MIQSSEIETIEEKFLKTKTIFQSNQTMLDQIKENIALINRNHSILTNQISIIHKQKFHLIQHLNFLQNQSLVKQQQILDIQTQFNQIKHSIDLNNQKIRRLTLEKQNISSFLLLKQHCIVLLHHQYMKFNTKNSRLNFHSLLKKIHQIRNEIIHELRSNQFLKNQERIDLKQSIISLRKDLFEYKKKNNNFQHRIHRQIFDNKSFDNGKKQMSLVFI
jgi:hypothetical protein